MTLGAGAGGRARGAPLSELLVEVPLVVGGVLGDVHGDGDIQVAPSRLAVAGQALAGSSQEA